MNARNHKSNFLSADAMILASSIFVAFGCIAESRADVRSPGSHDGQAVQEPDIGGNDGTYVASSFTGHRSVSEFGVDIEQQRDGLPEGNGNTLFRITTYSFLSGDATMPRRVRIHAGGSCFYRDRTLAVRDLHPAPSRHQADGVASEYFDLDFSIAERALVYEIQIDGRWVESNCTVTQPDQV